MDCAFIPLVGGLVKMNKCKGFILVAFLSFILTGCSSFNGIRQPLYDGNPVLEDEEAIETYQASREITGKEKDYYFRYPFSEAIYNKSLDYPVAEPLLLEEGEYIIGEDLPAGRVSLLSNESFFSRENAVIHVGNMIIYDEQDVIYFENLFHSEYGQLVAQVDFISGHRIEIIGEQPEITVFYEESFPEEPYMLMTPPEVLVNLERIDVKNPIIYEDEAVELSAGIFEVGVHLEPGSYVIQSVDAPHNTEMYLLRLGEEPRVFELLIPSDVEIIEENFEDYPNIRLQLGDKIYPHLVKNLRLVKVDD